MESCCGSKLYSKKSQGDGLGRNRVSRKWQKARLKDAEPVCTVHIHGERWAYYNPAAGLFWWGEGSMSLYVS